MSSALQLQELCDSITSFVQSSTDLKSCALVSHRFASSAQRQLFQEIILNRAYWTITSVNAQEYGVNEATMARRFIAVLRASPHLIPLVWRLRVGLEEAFLPQLSQIKFPNLQDVVFHRNLTGRSRPMPPVVCSAAMRMIALPSVRRLGLINAVFHNWQSFSQLCSDSTSQLKSLFLHDISVPSNSPDEGSLPNGRASIEQLQLSNLQTPHWLLDPLCPFDFSLLADVDLSSISVWDQVTTALIRGARRTITRLKLNANNGPDGMTILATLPALRHLSLVSKGIENVGRIIALLPSSNCVAFIDLYIQLNWWIMDDAWSRLATAIAASLPTLRRIHIQIHLDAPILDAAVLRTQLLTAFAEFETRGQLELPPFSFMVVMEVGRGALRHALVYVR